MNFQFQLYKNPRGVNRKKIYISNFLQFPPPRVFQESETRKPLVTVSKLKEKIT